MHDRIVTAFSGLGLDGIFRDVNDSIGNDDQVSENYIVWNYADNRGSNFADDEPGEVISTLQIHWFISETRQFDSTLASMRTALQTAGFTYPSFTVLYEKETHMRHIVMSTEFEE